MATKNQSQDQQQVDPQDLDLVDDNLEDEGRDEAELWSEFDQAEAQAATDDPEGPPDEGRTDDDGGDQGAADDAGRETDDSSADGGGSDAAAQGQSDGDNPPSDDADRQAQQLWANATPEQRAAFEAAQAQVRKLEQAERSNRGRLSALQRQINELMADRKPQPEKAASQQAADGQQGDGDGQPDGFLASDEWKAFQEEYPEVAGPMAKVIGNLQQHTTRLEKELSAIGADRRQSALEEQATLLADTHPDWEQVMSNRLLSEWLPNQPRHIREAALRNGNEIVDAEEAADVVDRFKAYLAAQGGNAQNQNNAPAGNGRGSGTNKALQGRRQRQLESATTARSRGPGAATGIPEDGDPEQIWRQFDEMERRQARV